jgi:hypothetical protein
VDGTSASASITISTSCDSDGDGYESEDCGGEDCDDDDASTYPYAGDSYGDGVDSDCDELDCEAGAIDGAYFAICPESNCTYHDCRSVCMDAGHDDLASIRRSEEQAFLESLFGTMPDALYVFGFTDEVSEGTWVWSDGATTTYTNWMTGEPNDLGGQDYGYFNWPDYTGEWDDGGTDSTTYPWPGFVCGAR